MPDEKLITECPNCGSEDFFYSDWEYSEEDATREVECAICGCTWVWVFKFAGNDIIYEGEPVGKP